MSSTIKFGVPGKVVDIPAPQVGMKFTNGRDIEETKLASGGRSVYAAPTTYKSFSANWTSYDYKLRALVDMYRGAWGTQAFWIEDKTADPVNVLPARWGSPHQLASVANGWCLPQVALGTGGPHTRQITFTQGPVGTNTKTSRVLRTRVLRLPGYGYYFSSDIDSTGGAGIIVRGFDSTTNTWTDIATYTTGQTNTLVIPASNTAYTFVEIDLYMPQYSTLTLRALVLGYSPRWNVTRQNLATNPSFETANGTVTVRTNYAQNPNFEGTSGTVNVRSNLCANPNFETNTSSWAALSGATITRDTTVFKSGSASMKVVCGTAAAGAGEVSYTVSGLAIGTVYTVQAAIRIPSGQADSPTVAVSCQTVGYGNTVSIYDTWVVSSYTFTATATSHSINIGAPSGKDDAAGDIFYVDEVAFEAIGYLAPYFDGSTAASGDFTYAWSGTANASISNQQAPGITWWAPRWFGNAGGTGFTYQTKSGRSGNACRKLWKTASGGSVLDTGITSGNITIAAGQSLAASAWMRSDVAQAFSAYIQWYDVNNTNIGGTSATTGYITLTPNVWGFNSVVAVAPANTSYAKVIFGPYGGSIQMAPGDYIDFDQALIEISTVVGSYFDGATAASGDYTFAWAGTANASNSYQKAVGLPSMGLASLCYAYQSTDWNSSRGHSARITPSSVASNASFFAPEGDQGAFRYGMQAGNTYTVSATCRLTAPLTGSLNAYSRLVQVVYYTGSWNYISSASAPNVAGSTRLSVTVTLPANATQAFVRLYNGAAQGGGDVWFDDLVVELGTTDGTYFDGTTAADPAHDTYYQWDGAADASTSSKLVSNVPGLPVTAYPTGTGIGAVQFASDLQGEFRKVGWYGMSVDLHEIENGEGLTSLV
jgi:hypothetical protein